LCALWRSGCRVSAQQPPAPLVVTRLRCVCW
jgi:hypothetical protein